MTKASYQQIIASRKAKKSKAKDAEGESSERTLSLSPGNPNPAPEGHPKPAASKRKRVEGPPDAIENLALEEVTSQPGSQGSRASGAAPGELWRKGLTPSVHAVVQAPSSLLQPKSLPADFMAFLNRAEEDALKVASLVSSFKDLHVSFEEASSGNAALTAQVAALIVEKEQSDSSRREAEERRQDLEKDLETVRGELEKEKAKLSTAIQDFTIKETAAAKALEKATTGLEEMENLVEITAVQAFDNAVAQARILNPDLTIEGMDVTAEVVDGKIVPTATD